MSNLLEPLGLGEADSRVFLVLLSAPRATMAELAEELVLPVDAVEHSIERLSDVGLVATVDTSPVRFALVPPESAVDAMVERRREQLDELRGKIRALAARFTSGTPGNGTDLVELIEGAEAIQQHAARLQFAAKDEVLLVDSPPYTAGQPGIRPELAGLARSVAYRTIYHAPVLREAAYFELMLEAVAAGERARSLPMAPMKMLIVDRRVAMVPMSFEASGRPAHLLVRPSPLLDALMAWFEGLWVKAAPIVVADGAAVFPGQDRPGVGELCERDRQILVLLASGAKDNTIARTIGVTERTLSRRISELMSRLSAESRFQAGLQAGRSGWL